MAINTDTLSGEVTGSTASAPSTINGTPSAHPKLSAFLEAIGQAAAVYATGLSGGNPGAALANFIQSRQDEARRQEEIDRQAKQRQEDINLQQQNLKSTQDLQKELVGLRSQAELKKLQKEQEFNDKQFKAELAARREDAATAFTQQLDLLDAKTAAEGELIKERGKEGRKTAATQAGIANQQAIQENVRKVTQNLAFNGFDPSISHSIAQKLASGELKDLTPAETKVLEVAAQLNKEPDDMKKLETVFRAVGDNIVIGTQFNPATGKNEPVYMPLQDKVKLFFQGNVPDSLKGYFENASPGADSALPQLGTTDGSGGSGEAATLINVVRQQLNAGVDPEEIRKQLQSSKASDASKQRALNVLDSALTYQKARDNAPNSQELKDLAGKQAGRLRGIG